MKPSDRLKEIEKAWNSYGHFGEPENDAIDWLINRVKRLTEALEKLSYEQPISLYRSEMFEIARKALEDEE